MGSIVHRNAPIRMQSAPKKQNVHFTSVQHDWVAVINHSREQVQAKGRGARIILNPGDVLNKNEQRRCVQFISAKHAKQMVHNNRAQLKAIPLKSGKKLLALAQQFAKEGKPDPFFAALAQLYPRLAVRNEVDVQREKRELRRLQTMYRAEFGQDADTSWTREQIMSKLRDKVNAFESNDGWLLKDSDNDQIDIDDLGDERTDVLAGIHMPTHDDEPEEEVAEEPPPVSEVKRHVVQSEDAERAAILQQLHSRGLKPHGRTSTPKLKELLVRALAQDSVAS